MSVEYSDRKHASFDSERSEIDFTESDSALSHKADYQNRPQHKSRRRFTTLHVASFVTLSACLSAFTTLLLYRALSTSSHTRPDTSLNAINNRTLGFEKVYSIGLSNHWHKRDAQSLSAQYIGFDITPVEGVRWEDIPKTEYPVGWHDPFPASIGCWRAHLNVLSDIVTSGVSSALILEDDADWDIFLKPQLQEFARGALQLQVDSSTHTSPYGDDWDMMQLGGCEFRQANHDNRYYLIEEDATVIPLENRHAQWFGPEEIPALNNTRTVFKYGYGTCTTSYAITAAAARKLLSSISLPPNVEESAIDRKYGRMCAHMAGEVPLNCYAVYPPLMGMHRFAGSTKADSDVLDSDDEEEYDHPEYTLDIQFSTSMNVAALNAGASVVEAQCPDGAAVKEIEVGMKQEWSGSVRYIEPREM